MGFVGERDVSSIVPAAGFAVGACIAGRVSCAVAIAFMSLAGSAAEWEYRQGPDLYGAEFQEYAVDESLSDKGALNGTWGTLPKTADAVAVTNESGHISMACHTPEAEGIVFTPDAEKSKGYRELKSVRANMCLAGFPEMPKDLDGDARTGFTIYKPTNAVDKATFMGWTNQGWTNLVLASGKVLPEVGGWCVVSIRLAKDQEGRVLVQYRLSVGTDSDGNDVFEALRTADTGAYWLVAGGNGDDPLVSEVEFRGDGYLERLDGSEPPRGLITGVGAK